MCACTQTCVRVCMHSWYIWSPVCAVVMVQKFWHELNIAQVRIDETYGQQYVYTQWSAVEVETPTHWNLIRCSVTTLLPVQSLSSILPPPSSYYAFIPAKKNWAHISKILFFLSLFISLFLFYFLKIMKFCKAWSA